MQSVTLDGVQGGLVRRTLCPKLLHRGPNPSQLEAEGSGWSGSAQARKHSAMYIGASWSKLCSPPAPLHPWQRDPPLPSKVVIDVSNHTPYALPSPEGWEKLRRNGRVWIVVRNRRVTVAQLDAAQYGMLLARYTDTTG